MKTTRCDVIAADFSRGFTLVEMIIVIVITGIIAAIVAVFIRAPVQGYVDLVARAELADEADTAVRRISRDLRLALPNSIRVSPNGNFLELLLTSTGGRYMTDADGFTTGKSLSFIDRTQLDFQVIGAFSTNPGQQIQPNNWIVVYNLGSGQAPADAYCTGSSCNNRAQVANIDSETKTVTLAANPFAPSPPVPVNPFGSIGAFRSPSNRFQVVTTPVTYLCDATTGTLTRYSDYAISQLQPTAPPTVPMRSSGSVISGLLANGVTRCVFSYAPLNESNGLVGIALTMQRPNTNSGIITLFHQVHVDNTP